MSVLDYPNGKVPLSEMDTWYGMPGAPDAIRAMKAIQAAIYAVHGVMITPNEIYRSYERQVLLRQLYLSGKGNVAAVPGTSNHGYGLAADFDYPVSSWTTVVQATFRAIEAQYQLSSAQGVADGEAWHKVYVGLLTTPAGIGGATPIDNTTTTDGGTSDMPYAIRILADHDFSDADRAAKDPYGTPIYGSTAYITAERGFVKTSDGLGSRGDFDAWSAICGALGYPQREVHVNKNGWIMARQRFTVPQ